MSPELSALLFDFGDVVCAYLPERRAAEYARLTGLSVDEVGRRLRDSGFHDDCDRGGFDAAGMLSELNRRLGARFTRQQARELQALAFEPRPEVIAVARDAGWQAIQFSSVPALRASLAELGVL